MKYYSEDHIWLNVSDGEAIVGITQYSLEELGKITQVELPTEDEDYIVGDVMATLNRMDIYAPLSGTVIEVNEELTENPALINRSPEEKGWLCVIKDFDDSELDDMMTADAYFKYLETLQE